jgi:tetratricopeptide (TPR) repeat protein
MREAVRAFGRQEFEVALAHLERLGDAERERLDVRCLRAAIFLQRAELQEAERLCQEVLARDPWHADAHFMLGLTHRQRGRLEAAVQALKQAIYLQPGHRDAHFFLAETYRSLGLAAQARHEYENTLNILADAAQGRDEPAFHLTGLADEKLRHACQVNLKNLRPSPRLHPEQRARRW